MSLSALAGFSQGSKGRHGAEGLLSLPPFVIMKHRALSYGQTIQVYGAGMQEDDVNVAGPQCAICQLLHCKQLLHSYMLFLNVNSSHS